MLYRRRRHLIACIVLTALPLILLCIAIPASANGLCSSPAESCGAILSPACLDRVGASALPILGGDCGAQLERYRGCLSTVITACTPPQPEESRKVTLPPGDMLAIWSEVKDSGDANALETFAQNFKGTTLGALASSRARTIREEARQTEVDKNAKEVWAYMKDAGDPTVLEDFAAEFPNNKWAYEALDLAAKMRTVSVTEAEEKADETDAEPVSASTESEVVAEVAALAARETKIARNRDAQRELNRLGYGAGPVDGAFGPRSRAALIAFQQAEGLRPDGALNDAVLAALRASRTLAAASRTAAAATRRNGKENTPDELQANISWRLRRGFSGDEIEGSCETFLRAVEPAESNGSRTYANAYQRCEAETISYQLTINPVSRIAYGEFQVETYEGNSRRLQISGSLPALTAQLGSSQVTLILSQP